MCFLPFSRGLVMNLLHSQCTVSCFLGTCGCLPLLVHSTFTSVSYVTITNGQMQSLNLTILLFFCINAFSSENGQKAKPWKEISAFGSPQETEMDPKEKSYFHALFYSSSSSCCHEMKKKTQPFLSFHCLLVCQAFKLEVKKKKKHGCLWISNVSVCEWTRQPLHAWLVFHSHTQ